MKTQKDKITQDNDKVKKVHDAIVKWLNAERQKERLRLQTLINIKIREIKEDRVHSVSRELIPILKELKGELHK